MDTIIWLVLDFLLDFLDSLGRRRLLRPRILNDGGREPGQPDPFVVLRREGYTGDHLGHRA